MEDYKSTEVIAQEMHETKQSLTDKVSALEGQVVGTLQSATTAVQETVQSVKSAVQDTVSSVSDNVKNTFDITTRVQANPWVAVGSAAAAGFLTSLLVFRGRSTSPAPSYAQPFLAPQPVPNAPRPVAASAGPSVLTPLTSVFHELLTMAGDEAKKLGESAIATLSKTVRETIDEGLPRLIEERVFVRRPVEAANGRS